MRTAADCRTSVWRPGWPCDPLDVLRSLRRGAHDPTFQLDSDGSLWRSATTPQGPVTLCIRRRPALGEIELAAWGSGAEWMLAQAPAMLGALDDVSSFAPAHPRLRRAWDASPHWRIPRTGLVLEALVAAAIEQKVTGQEAWLGWRRLLTRFGDAAPGPGAARAMHVLPDAESIARIPSWEWLRCSIDGARSKTIVRAAKVAPALERTLERRQEDVEAVLCSLPGVGVWTAAEVRQRAHGDPDAVSFGDYHVAGHVGWALTGAKIDDEALATLLEPYRPHRFRVQHLAISRMSGPPRRGPRMPPRRHLPR